MGQVHVAWQGSHADVSPSHPPRPLPATLSFLLFCNGFGLVWAGIYNPLSSPQFAMSDMSAPRTQTLARIRELEASLTSARREREVMESSIRQLRDTMGGGGAF